MYRKRTLMLQDGTYLTADCPVCCAPDALTVIAGYEMDFDGEETYPVFHVEYFSHTCKCETLEGEITEEVWAAALDAYKETYSRPDDV